MSTNININIYNTIRETVLTAKNKVYSAVNFAMVEAYWGIGKQIAEAQDELKAELERERRRLEDDLTEQ